MQLFGFALVIGVVIEGVLIPAVAGACAPQTCASNKFGIQELHALAIGALIGGIAVNWPSIAKFWRKLD